MLGYSIPRIPNFNAHVASSSKMQRNCSRMQNTACFRRRALLRRSNESLRSSALTQRTGMQLAHKPSLKFGQKPRDDLSVNAATVECALPIRTASNGISARPIKEMDSDQAQAALATVCRYVQKECRDQALTQVRQQRRAAIQRAMVARRSNEEMLLEVLFLPIQDCLY